jgi:hypothetical protein
LNLNKPPPTSVKLNNQSVNIVRDEEEVTSIKRNK